MEWKRTWIAAGAAVLLGASAGAASAQGYTVYGGYSSSGYTTIDGAPDDGYADSDGYAGSADDQNGPLCHHNRHHLSYKDDPGSYGSYKDDYGQAYTGSYRRYSYRTVRRGGGQCLGRHEIEDSLVRQGWRDLTGLKLAPDLVGITGVRPNGLAYRLKLDRCTGVILAATLVDQLDNGYGPTASAYELPY